MPSPETPPSPGTAPGPVLPAEFLRGQRYVVGARVARGGMGAILEARETAIGRRVAMKVMLDGASAADLARIVAEAKITGQLEHPNIVPVHELGVDAGGQVFYTMKFVRGRTLREVLDELGGVREMTDREGSVFGPPSSAFSLPVLLTVFQKVCDAVAFAHAQGVIHRDLKPENLMLGEFGEVLVMDWGVAKVLERNQESEVRSQEIPRAAIPSVAGGNGRTRAGTILGTPGYMSPEQARGEVETLDARTDIYALGAILYSILTLRLPVEGADGAEIVARVARGAPLVLQWESAAPLPPRARVPDSLAAVVRKAMAFDREARYAAVPELQAEIAAYQAGFATAAEHAGFFKHTALLIRRHRAAFATAAAALLLIVGLAGWFILSIARERDLARRAAGRAERGERIAETERDKAVRAEAESTAIVNFLEKEVLGLAGSSRARSRDTTLREAMIAAESTLGRNFSGQPLVEASVHRIMGLTYRRAGDTARAIARHEQALRLRTEVLGQDHAETLTSADDLAETYRAAGRTEDALRLLEREVPRMLATGHPRTRTNVATLALAYFEQQRYAESEQRWRDLRDWLRRRDPLNYLDSARALIGMGDALLRQAKFAEAEAAFAEAWHSLRPQIPNSLLTLNTQVRLGVALLGQKKYATAETHLLAGHAALEQQAKDAASAPAVPDAPAEAGRAVRRRSPNADERSVQDRTGVMQSLVRLYERWGKPEEAALWTQRIEDLGRRR